MMFGWRVLFAKARRLNYTLSFITREEICDMKKSNAVMALVLYIKMKSFRLYIS